VEHEALALISTEADVFGGGEGLDAGDGEQVGGGSGRRPKRSRQDCFEGIDGFFGAGFGEFAVGGDAELGFGPARRREEGGDWGLPDRGLWMRFEKGGLGGDDEVGLEGGLAARRVLAALRRSTDWRRSWQ
jgi:hypothetical protein